MIENENKARDIIQLLKGSIPFSRAEHSGSVSGVKVLEFFSNSRFSIKKLSNFISEKTKQLKAKNHD